MVFPFQLTMANGKIHSHTHIDWSCIFKKNRPHLQNLIEIFIISFRLLDDGDAVDIVNVHIFAAIVVVFSECRIDAMPITYLYLSPAERADHIFVGIYYHSYVYRVDAIGNVGLRLCGVIPNNIRKLVFIIDVGAPFSDRQKNESAKKIL